MEEKDIIELIGKISFKDEIFPAKEESWKQIQKTIVQRKRKLPFLNAWTPTGEI